MIPESVTKLIRNEGFRNRVRSEQSEKCSDSLRGWMFQSIHTQIAGGEVERGRQLLKGVVQLGGFDPVDVGIEPDWTENPIDDRNWLWRWHQWEYTRDFLKLWTVEKDETSLLQLLAWVNGWLDAHLWGESNLKMAWHDHATALRLRNLFHIWALLNDNEYADADVILVIEDAIAAHCAILSTDLLYSAMTNHGWDQMSVLLQVARCCCIFEESSEWANVANTRLHDEIEFAFTADGVHVENSPAYHQSMLLRLIENSDMFESLEIETDIPLDDLIRRGMNFLSWIVRPDGTLPLIGDTVHTAISPIIDTSKQNDKKSLIRFIESEGADGTTGDNHRVFTHSGWAVIRYPSAEGAAFEDSLHLVLKSGFLSTYHRHDDDTHFVLNAFRSEWLIDGGMYNYQERDPRRVFVRSPLSHNLVVLPGIPIHRNPELGSNTTGVHDLSVNGAVRLGAYSEMYEGFKLHRTIEHKGGTEFIIHDRVEIIDVDAQIPSGSHVRFHFPAHLDIELKNSQSAVITREDGCRMTLSALQGVDSIIHHVGTFNGVIQSWRSIEYGIGEDAQVLCFQLDDSEDVSQIRLDLEEV